MTSIRMFLGGILSISLLSGCVVDLTGKSGSHLLQSRMDMLREKNRALEEDLARERGRVDRIEQRATEARRRYADAGASVQALMEDLARLRGEVAAVSDELSRRGTLTEDIDFRLNALEGQLVYVEDALVAGLEGYELAPVVIPTSAPETAAQERSGEVVSGAATDSRTRSVESVETAAESSTAVAAQSESVAKPQVESPPPAAPSNQPAEEPEPAAPPPDLELFEEGKKLYSQKKWREAGRRFLKIRKKFKDSEYALESQFLLSMCLFELARYKDALSEFQRVIDARASVELSAQAMFMQGMSFLKLGTTEDREAAEIFFSDVVANWPKSSWAKKAKSKLGELRGN